MSGGGNDNTQPLGVYKTKEMIHDIFLQTGQKDLLMAHIRQKTTQQGWTWTMRDEFVDYIKKRGPDNVNVSHMIADLAPVGRELFPSELKKELVEAIFEVTKNYFTIDDSVSPNLDPDDEFSGPEKTFLYQSKDVKPDPGLGIGVETPDSPPPSPQSSASASSTPNQSPGPITVSNPIVPRQSPAQSTPRQSPGAAPRQSPVSAPPRSPLDRGQPLPPPPVLRPETVSTSKSIPVVANDDEEQEDEEDEDDDIRNNDEDDEDELMDV